MVINAARTKITYCDVPAKTKVPETTEKPALNTLINPNTEATKTVIIMARLIRFELICSFTIPLLLETIQRNIAKIGNVSRRISPEKPQHIR